MDGLKTGLRVLAVAGGMLALAACSSAGPRYSISPVAAPPRARTPAAPAYPNTAYPNTPAPSGDGVRSPTNPANEAPPPSRAPVEIIEGGALDMPPARQPAAGPASDGF